MKQISAQLDEMTFFEKSIFFSWSCLILSRRKKLVSSRDRDVPSFL